MVRRRTVLAGAAGIAAAIAGGVALYRRDGDGDGIEDVSERGLDEVIKEEYGAEQVPELDPEGKDLIVDAHYVEGESFDDRYKEAFEELFAEQDISLHWLDHPDRYDRERFLDRYGHDVEDVLSCDGFYEEVVRDELRDDAVQLLFVPGKPDDPHEGELYSADNPGVDDDHHFFGYSRGDRAAVGSRPEGDRRAVTVLHEIGHLVLDHHYDDEDNPGVMGQKEELDFTEEEWDELRKNLWRVDLGWC